MKLYLVNLNNGKIEEHIINNKNGERFKIDTEQNIIVNEFFDDLIHVVFYRRRAIY